MITTKDLYILLIIYLIICYVLYDMKLLKYKYDTLQDEFVMLIVICVLNLWLTFYMSVNNVQLFTDSKSVM